MNFFIHFIMALASLVAIVFSCILFTNAIEFLGNKLKLGNNATGSILAVIGTGLPEFIVPLVAICGMNFSGFEIELAQNIALGAILGSPFMLSTFALFLLGLVLLIKKRDEVNIDTNFVLRDYKYILLAYFISFLFSLEFLNNFRYVAAFILVGLYFLFVLKTILKSRCACIECECEKLYFGIKNTFFAFTLQFLVSIFILIFSSHCFVCEIRNFSIFLGVAPSALSLIVVPFATELPECVNSVIWMKQGKDDLALANVLGAIVFQVTLLFSIGMFLTNWKFDNILLFNFMLSIFWSLIFTAFIWKNKKIKFHNLLIAIVPYFVFLVYVLMKYFCKIS